MTAIIGFRREDATAQPASLSPAYESTRLRSPLKPLVRLPHTLSEITGPTGSWDRLMGPAADDRAELPIDPDGTYRFETIRPGRVPGWGNALQAPHLAVGVFGRGLLKRLVTRIYFEDSAENAEDPVLDLVEPAHRHTLIARREPHETVFFDC